MFNLFLLFTVVPIVELYLLIYIGSRIGFAHTCLIVFGTGVLGTFLVKMEGLSIVNKIRNDFNNGIIPEKEIMNGLLLLVGAVFLITPGVITDVVGVLLILPGTRDIIRFLLVKRFKNSVRFVNISSQKESQFGYQQRQDNVIDGEAKIK